MAKDQVSIPTDLTEMKEKLAEWRSTQPPRTPLPDSLWQAIIKLARKHGLYRTAKSLPIDYGTLQRRCSGHPVRRRAAAPASFVELIAPVAPTTSYAIELVRIESTGAVDWSQLLEAWRRRGA
ncbi:MAG TPA: hypothetical protein VN664_11855 [Burkholderiales bacterium]|nr:hypothetical protein [Burkholderiales bacterium]